MAHYMRNTSHELKLRFRALQGFNRISKVYQKKLIKTGNFAEIYDFHKCQISFKSERETYIKSKTGVRNIQSLKRARRELFRLITGNIGAFGAFLPVFVTLTFADNLSDLDIANKEFLLFVKRLSYHTGIKQQYVVIPEFQKRGAVHYHGVFFNLPFIEVAKFEQIWANGQTNIQVARIKNTASYLCKYFSKSSYDRRLFGRKAYFASRGLQRPIHTYGLFEVDNFVATVTMEQTQQIVCTNYILTKNKITHANT